MHRIIHREIPDRVESIFHRFASKSLEKRLGARIDRYSGSVPHSMAVFAHDYISLQINLHGFFERRYLDLLMQFLGPVVDELQSGIVLDVGANIGNHTLYFSRHFSRIQAYEPDPETFELLQFNTRHTSGITALNIGLGSQSATMKMARVRGNRGASQVVSAGDGVEVRIETLDALAVGLDVAFVKIDTEGFEFEVLNGATDTLRRCMPVIVFEQNSNVFHAGRTPSIDLLRSFGYEIAWMDYPSRDLSNPVRRMVTKIGEAIGGRSYRILIGDSVPHRNHIMLIAIPPKFKARLVGRNER